MLRGGSSINFNPPRASPRAKTTPPSTPPSYNPTTPLNYHIDSFPDSVDIAEDEYYFELLYKGNFGLTNFEEGTLWTARMRFLERLNDPTSATAPGSMENVFMASIAGTGVEEFHNVRTRIRNFVVPLSKGDQSTRESRANELKVSFDSLHQQTNAWLEAGDSIQMSQFFTARTTSGQAIDSLKVDVLYYDSTLLARRVDSVTAILSAIAALPDTILPQWTEKEIDRLFISIALDGVDSISSTDLNLLGTIASLCPLEAGDPVYWARSLYWLVDPTIRFDDLQNCAVAPSPKPLPANSTDRELSIYPNPASDLLQVVSENEETDLSGRDFSIIDQAGRIISVSAAAQTEKRVVFDVRSLPVGTYFLRMYSSDSSKQLQTIPFVIQR
jgi:hypothetical protein